MAEIKESMRFLEGNADHFTDVSGGIGSTMGKHF